VDLLERGSLPNAWAQEWRAAPYERVLRDIDGTWLDGFDMLDRTARVAGRLHGAGLRAGDRVLVSGEQSADFVIAHCAALRLGLVVVPTNSAYSQREIDVLLELASPRAAILERDQLRAWMPSDVLTTGIDVDLPDAIVPELDGSSPDDPALLPFTSGTTGVPKGAPLSHGNLLASAEAVRLAWEWTPADTLLLCLPLFHVHGLGVGLHGAFNAGAAIQLQRGFDPEAVLAATDETTMFFGVPTMYARLAAADGLERLGRLRLCVSGSAPLSAELHERIRAASGQTILERYGMTETLITISTRHDGERRPGQVGMPIAGVESRLRADDGSEVAHDGETIGNLQIRGATMFDGYLNLPDKTAESFTSDGWFLTGDSATIGADGVHRIVGRSSIDIIKCGGFKVGAGEVESALLSHPAVAEVAVIGVADADLGERIVAFVVGDVTDSGQLIDHVAQLLSVHKRPREIRVVDTLPRNAMGKVQKQLLRGT